MSAIDVCFIDDDEMIRVAAKQALSLANFKVQCFDSADSFLKKVTVRPDWAGVVVSDLKMPGTSGLELQKIIHQKDEQLPVILVSGHADIATAIQSIRDGAYDFVEKPFSAANLCDVVSRAVDKRLLVLDNRSLRAELSNQQQTRLLLGASPAMESLNQTIEYIAQTDADVLVMGETGTGKELVANCLHSYSPRQDKNFVAINCGAMPETLFESEIFGHVRGAFTNAFNNQVGKLEYANHGTFFLDEVESMPLNLQIKLLRVLQERKSGKVGSNEETDLDLRVVAATKADLLAASQAGSFREDLYYRLNVVTLTIPPLRDRKEDIPLLFQHFFDGACKRTHKEAIPLPASWVQSAMQHNWPGNVRELRNFAERAAIAAHVIVDMPQQNAHTTGADVESQLLGSLANPQSQNVQSVQQDSQGQTSSAVQNNHSLQQRMDGVEKHLIEQELIRNSSSINKTYSQLGISRKTLYDKMKKHGIKRRSATATSED